MSNLEQRDQLAAAMAEAERRGYTTVEIEMDALRDLAKALEEAEGEKDEARRIAGLGCDANGHGAHTPHSQGRYVFCEACGETLTSPKLSERLALANSRAEKAEAENLRLREALEPFAKHADSYTPELPRTQMVLIAVSGGNLFDSRQALLSSSVGGGDS